MKIACLLSDGFEDIEALGTIALLRRSGIDCDMISVYNQTTVVGSYKTVVTADLLFNELDIIHYDGVFIPGGRHATVLRENNDVKDLVLEFRRIDKWIFAICAAPSILGVTGILDGVKYTSFPSTEVFIPYGIRQSAKVVQDKKIITGVGAGAVYEFAFLIIEALLGKEKRLEIEKRTQYVLN